MQLPGIPSQLAAVARRSPEGIPRAARRIGIRTIAGSSATGFRSPPLDLGRYSEKKRSVEELLKFRQYFAPKLHEKRIASLIVEYADLCRFGVVAEPDKSEEEVKDLVKKFYDIDLTPRCTLNTVQSQKFWFLPGWFLMPGAHGVVLKVRTPSTDSHYILITAYTHEYESPNMSFAQAFDSGRVVSLSCREDVQEYLHINGYTDICPMAIGYPKSHRSNQIVGYILEFTQIYFDIDMIEMPQKAGEIRNFYNNRNKFLEQYFNKVEQSPKEQLRFRSKFLLSSPVDFPESEKYSVEMVKEMDTLLKESDSESVVKLKQYIEELPLYRYERQKMKFPQISRASWKPTSAISTPDTRSRASTIISRSQSVDLVPGLY
eukprot:CAMPEP_0197543110 /NCGR_PEP_ID=MMETSP1318-20131121/68064_1 /TAXON_ID=552666 /ORGANISM="Partenskyella glossopodia, Strain RCC365" /LENGTH=374 /DNA_ID=CAMNT_0043102423 /DNA_START=135 /DNA_END=1258 /DNA_ORIENTATION=+